MAKGTIKRIIRDRGFGFIKPSGSGEDIFFHRSTVQGVKFEALREGDEVTYESEMGRKGARATGVRAVGKASAPDEEPYRFLNPYNFVSYLPSPLIDMKEASPEQKLLWRCPPPPHDRYVGLKGRITCEVKAVTPLFVSDSHAVKKDQHKHKSYRFFEYEGRAALPATTLRGAMRSVFEAVTNSCFSVFDSRRLSYRLPATRATELVPSRIERHNGQWMLRLLSGFVSMTPGKRPSGTYAATVHLYDPIRGRRIKIPKVDLHGMGHEDECYALVEKKGIFTYVQAVAESQEDLPRPSQNSQKIVQGWLCINNQNVDNKRKERFFFRDPMNTTGPRLIPLPDPARKAYEDLIADYQLRHEDRVKERKESGQPLDKPTRSEEALSRYMYNRADRKVHEGTLVYAALSGSAQNPQVKGILMAPAAIPRVSYENTIGDLLPYAYLHPCQDLETLCPACRAFGWVRKVEAEEELPVNKLVALAGRLRFSHGELLEDKGTLPPTTLAILSSPKPTTTRFYLRPTRTRPVDGLRDEQAGYDGDNMIRGRKFYRHHGEADPQEYERATDHAFDGKDDQNRTIRGARKPGTRFEFTIDFHNMTEVELGALLWTLELQEGQRRGYHRIGLCQAIGFWQRENHRHAG